MKLILYFFEQLSGLKINFHKSDFFVMVRPRRKRITIGIFFGCEVGSLPFKYFGIPIH
jgi:hypothetical protein